MTPTTSAQIEDIFTRACALQTWDQSLLAELYAALVEPFQTFYNWTLAPYQPDAVTDNLYRLKPRDWKRAEQELGPHPDGSSQGAVASFALWQIAPGTTYYGTGAESYSGQTHPSLAIAMLASTAKLWHSILVGAGR